MSFKCDEQSTGQHLRVAKVAESFMQKSIQTKFDIGKKVPCPLFLLILDNLTLPTSVSAEPSQDKVVNEP